MTARLTATLLLVSVFHLPVAVSGTAAPDTPSSTQTKENVAADSLREQIGWYREELERLEKSKAEYTASITSHEAELEANRAEEKRIREEIQRLQKALSPVEEAANETAR